MTEKTFIYILIDPRTNEVRYVGKSNNPKKRLFAYHIPQSKLKRTHKECWIYSLINKNLSPILKIIEETDLNNWCDREKYYIKHYLESGCNLVNATDGGDSYNFTDETRQKLSQVLKNHPSHSKQVFQFDCNCNMINNYPSIAEASRITKISSSNICNAINGKLCMAGNYYWSYVKEFKIKNISKYKRTVYQIDDFGNLVNEYKSIIEASKSIGRHPSSIQSALDVNNRKSGNFYWLSKDKYNMLKSLKK